MKTFPPKLGIFQNLWTLPSTNNMSVDMLIRYEKKRVANFYWSLHDCFEKCFTHFLMQDTLEAPNLIQQATNASWSIHRYNLIMVAFQVEYIFDKVCASDLSLAKTKTVLKIRISFGDIVWLSTPWSLWSQQNGWLQGWSAGICKGGMQNMFIDWYK